MTITYVWFLKYRARWTDFSVILHNFLPFYSPNNPKNQNFEKLTKMPSDIIIFQMCTINDNHMMFCSWNMQCDGQNFLSFWTIFCPFITPLKTWKINIKKKWKEHLEILSLSTSVSKIMIICYPVPETERQTEGQKKWHTEVGAPPKKNIRISTSFKCILL